jgi:putative ABC transport system permease protein
MGRGQFGHSLVDKLVENIRGFSRPLLISVRNTFRRKGRLALTLITLALGGAIFVAVFNLRESMLVFVEQIGKYFLSDVNVGLYQAYHWKEVEACLMEIPGVEQVEGCGFL